jgi:hypothetical protein
LHVKRQLFRLSSTIPEKATQYLKQKRAASRLRFDFHLSFWDGRKGFRKATGGFGGSRRANEVVNRLVNCDVDCPGAQAKVEDDVING